MIKYYRICSDKVDTSIAYIASKAKVSNRSYRKLIYNSANFSVFSITKLWMKQLMNELKDVDDGKVDPTITYSDKLRENFNVADKNLITDFDIFLRLDLYNNIKEKDHYLLKMMMKQSNILLNQLFDKGLINSSGTIKINNNDLTEYGQKCIEGNNEKNLCETEFEKFVLLNLENLTLEQIVKGSGIITGKVGDLAIQLEREGLLKRVDDIDSNMRKRNRMMFELKISD